MPQLEGKVLVYSLPGADVKRAVHDIASAYRREEFKIEGRQDQKGLRGFLIIRAKLGERDFDPKRLDSLASLMRKWKAKPFMRDHKQAIRFIDKLQQAAPPFFRHQVYTTTVQEIARLAFVLDRMDRVSALSQEGRRLVRDMDISFRSAINDSFKGWASDPFLVPWISAKGHQIQRRVRLRDFMEAKDFERLVQQAAGSIMASAKKHFSRRSEASMFYGMDRAKLEDVVMEVVAALLGGKKNIWEKAKHSAYKAMDEAVKYVLGARGRPSATRIVDQRAVEKLKSEVDREVQIVAFDEAEEARKKALVGIRKAIRMFGTKNIPIRETQDETPQSFWKQVRLIADSSLLSNFLKTVFEFKADNKTDHNKVTQLVGRVMGSVFDQAFRKIGANDQAGITRKGWDSVKSRARGRFERLLKSIKASPPEVQQMLAAMSPVIRSRQDMLEKVFQKAPGLQERLMAVWSFAPYLGQAISNSVKNAIRHLEAIFSMKEGGERAYLTQDAEGEAVNILGMFQSAVADVDAPIDFLDFLRNGLLIDAGGRKAKIMAFKDWVMTNDPEVKKFRKKPKEQYKFVLRMIELMMGQKLGTGQSLPTPLPPDPQVINYMIEETGLRRSTAYRWAKEAGNLFKEYEAWRKQQRLDLVGERRGYWQKQRADAGKRNNPIGMKRADEEINKAERAIGVIRRHGSEVAKLVLVGALIRHVLRWNVTSRIVIASKKERYKGMSPLAIQVERVVRNVLA